MMSNVDHGCHDVRKKRRGTRSQVLRAFSRRVAHGPVHVVELEAHRLLSFLYNPSPFLPNPRRCENNAKGGDHAVHVYSITDMVPVDVVKTDDKQGDREQGRNNKIGERDAEESPQAVGKRRLKRSSSRG